MVKSPLANARDIRETGLIPGLGRSPGGGHGNPLQYSCLEHPMDRSVVGYSPWAHKELDMTEQLSTHPHGQVTYPLLLLFPHVIKELQDFSGGSVIKTPHSQCKWPGLILAQGTISHTR